VAVFVLTEAELLLLQVSTLLDESAELRAAVARNGTTVMVLLVSRGASEPG
jgi:hypothetical protein